MSNAGSQTRDGVVRVFDQVARVYNLELLQRAVYRPNHDAVIRELERVGARRVLDVGCGTGLLTARIAAELGPEIVYGVDASEGMLEQARVQHASVTWIQGSAERIPIEDGALDAVICTEAFHFFDQPAALREFRRVLGPGGHVVVAVITPHLPTMQLLGDSAAARWPTRAQLRAMFASAGLSVQKQRPVRPWLGPLWPGVATVAVRNPG
ncbi:MAG: class I SAM-dependent methyltransferase [Solirubrobacteraceae bacterium]